MTSITKSPSAERRTGDHRAGRLDRILGDHAAVTHVDGVTTVTPRSDAACARAVAECAANGWRIGVMGSGGWIAERARSDVVIATGGLKTIEAVRPADLYATVGAGVRCEELAKALASHGVWLPVDPPGADRSLGSVLATATQGALRTGFGTIRDQILGATVVTGNGRLLRIGGRVVKNVAGFDLTKLVVGGFGAYGIVTAAHLKLRTTPAHDVTAWVEGERTGLLALALAILDAGLSPASLELSSGGGGWRLDCRAAGSEAFVDTHLAAMRRVSDDALTVLDAAPAFWGDSRASAASYPLTIRLGTTMKTLPHALALTDALAGRRSVTFASGGGVLRWSGSAAAEDLLHLRRAAAEHLMPVTLERGPPTTLRRVGHFGALSGGTDRLARELQRVFDPAGVFHVPLWES